MQEEKIKGSPKKKRVRKRGEMLGKEETVKVAVGKEVKKEWRGGVRR